MSTSSAAATPWASPASPLKRSGSRRQSSLTVAGAKSSPSTPPTRHGGGHVPQERTLVLENERLKRELEELRQLTARPGAPQVRSTQPMPRGYGRSFGIRSWEAEKSGAVVAAGTLGTVQRDAAAENSLSVALPEPAKIVASELGEREDAAARKQLPSWLLQRWSDGCEVQGPLREAARAGMETVRGSRERAHEAFQQAFAAHLQIRKRVHLSFSAALPCFFAELMKSPADIHPGQLVAPGLRASEAKTSAFACLAELLRQLQGAARFGDKPPIRPEGMEKWEFVRELSSQAGLSLDLVRVHQAYRRHRRRQKPSHMDSDQTTLAIKDGVETSVEGKKGRGLELPTEATPETDSNPVSQAEAQSALTRAGAYLRALQMPLEQLRDSANTLAASSKQRQSSRRGNPKDVAADAAAGSQSAPLLASSGDLGPLLPIADAEVAGDDGEKDSAAEHHVAPDRQNDEEEEKLGDPVAIVSSAIAQPKQPEEPPVLLVQEGAKSAVTLAEEHHVAPDRQKEEEKQGDSVSVVPSAISHPQLPEESAVLQVQEEARSAMTLAEQLPELPVGISQQGVVDELLIPSFGQFIDQQLLPLYFRDIPFRILKDTLEHYCGVPIDSDDEEKASKLLDISTKQKATPSRPSKLKRRASEASGDGISMPPTPSSQASTSLKAPPPDVRRQEEPLAPLIQAVGSKPAIRSQMSHSVIEKRRTGGQSMTTGVLGAVPPPSLRVPEGKRAPAAKEPSLKRMLKAASKDSGKSSSHPARSQKIVATPRVSKALLVSPATAAASAKKRRLLISPVQWRATQSFDRPPDENPETSAKSASIADFSIFEEDTPWKKKKEGEACF